MCDAQEAWRVLLFGADLDVGALKPFNIEFGHGRSRLELDNFSALESTSVHKKADLIEDLPEEIILVLFLTHISPFS